MTSQTTNRHQSINDRLNAAEAGEREYLELVRPRIMEHFQGRIIAELERKVMEGYNKYLIRYPYMLFGDVNKCYVFHCTGRLMFFVFYDGNGKYICKAEIGRYSCDQFLSGDKNTIGTHTQCFKK